MTQNKWTNESEHLKALEEQARKSGLTYNEAIEWMTRKTGGYGTSIYSDTDVQSVQKQVQQSSANKQE